MIVAKVLQKGQIVIPKEIRKKTNIKPGNKVEVMVVKERIVITPFKESFTERFKGIIKGRLSLDELERLYGEKT
ncbi:MAG: AbrB/MazE/SpoVT family DNA-binding domain-containing protein [bacterium]